MAYRLLLGPQRPIANLAQAVAGAGLDPGPVAVIAAGWQEAEADLDELQGSFSGPLINLELYRRAEEVFAADNHLRNAYRERQDRLQELQRLYRTRLRQLMIAARQIKLSGAAADLVAAEYRHAVSQLRALDRHQLKRIDAVYTEFSRSTDASRSDVLGGHIAAISQVLADCGTVVITGGNVLVLINRLQLFGLRGALEARHLVAWSAGAMALSDRVVLYHERTPVARRDPELLGAGLGIVSGYVFLPDARRRLRAKDSVRLALLSSRFSPARCVTLDSGASVRLDGGALCEARNAACVTSRGGLTPLGAQ